MKQDFRVPYTDFYFRIKVSQGQLINLWKYLRSRRSLLQVAQINKEGKVEIK